MSGPKTATRRRKNAKHTGAKEQKCSAPTVCCKQIRETAYFKWEVAGCPCGDGVEFWLEAEAELASGNRPSKPR